MVLLANITLALKGMTGMNTLAYFARWKVIKWEGFVGATTFSITTLCLMTFMITTLSIMTLIITSLSIITLRSSGSEWRNDTQHNDTQYNDTHHNDTHHNDTQHNEKIATPSILTPSIIAYDTECFYAVCHLW